jgi:hypothetical protein
LWRIPFAAAELIRNVSRLWSIINAVHCRQKSQLARGQRRRVSMRTNVGSQVDNSAEVDRAHFSQSSAKVSRSPAPAICNAPEAFSRSIAENTSMFDTAVKQARMVTQCRFIESSALVQPAFIIGEEAKSELAREVRCLIRFRGPCTTRSTIY